MKTSHLASPLVALSLALLASASCGDDSKVTAAQLQVIAPNSKSCDNPPAAGECATAEQAAPFINASFDTNDVSSPAEQAAVISLMAFETADFKYNRNHFPGRPGQGSTYLIRLRTSRRELTSSSAEHANAALQPRICGLHPRTGRPLGTGP